MRDLCASFRSTVKCVLWAPSVDMQSALALDIGRHTNRQHAIKTTNHAETFESDIVKCNSTLSSTIAIRRLLASVRLSVSSAPDSAA